MLKGALIGCGPQGHLCLQAWKKVRSASIEAVVDLDSTMAAALARRYYVPHHYNNIDVMLSRERIDFVHIAVGVDGQPTLVRKCLEAGLHVLASSPPAASLNVASDLVDAATGRKLVFMFGYLERWRAVFRALKQAVDGGAIGDVHYAHIFDRRPMGRSRPADPQRPGLDTAQNLLVLEGLLDYVDLVRFVFGDVASVLGTTLKLNSAVKGEDFALATIRTEGKVAANILLDINWSSPLPGRAFKTANWPAIRVEGSSGALELDPAAGVIRVRRHTGAPTETPLPAVPDIRMEPHLEIQGHFIESIESGTSARCSGEDALKSLRAALAIYESERSGGMVLIRKP